MNSRDRFIKKWIHHLNLLLMCYIYKLELNIYCIIAENCVSVTGLMEVIACWNWNSVLPASIRSGYLFQALIIRISV